MSPTKITHAPLSLPFVATTLSLVFLFGVTVLLAQMMQVQEFLVEQYIRTSDDVTYMREKVTELKVEVAEQHGTVEVLRTQFNGYAAPSQEQP